MNITAYEISEPLYIRSRPAAFQGNRPENSLSVNIKPSTPRPTTEYDQVHTTPEVEFLCNPSLQGIPSPVHSELNSQPIFLILKNRNGIPLEKFMIEVIPNLEIIVEAETTVDLLTI